MSLILGGAALGEVVIPVLEGQVSLFEMTVYAVCRIAVVYWVMFFKTKPCTHISHSWITVDMIFCYEQVINCYVNHCRTVLI